MSVAVMQEQHKRWRLCGSRKDRLFSLCECLWDGSRGKVTTRCKQSLYLQLGVSGNLVDAASAYLATEEAKRGELLRHGNAERAPWNKWPAERLAAVLKHFDIYTIGRPEDNTLRPVEV